MGASLGRGRAASCRPIVHDGAMRVLLVSDLHYTLRQLDWVADRASEVDLVVIAGDLLDIASTVPLEAQVVLMVRYLRELTARVPVAVSSGNHDLTGPDAHGEQAALWMEELRALGVATDGDSLELGGAFLSICPWWDGPIGRARVVDQLNADAAAVAALRLATDTAPDEGPPWPWLWVYHWPPDSTRTCWTGRRHYGDADLLGWVEEHHPDVVLAGHVHEPPFKPDGSWADKVGRTWVFNAGRQIGPEPTHVLLDLAARTARWSSLLGDETVELDGPVPLDRPALA